MLEFGTTDRARDYVVGPIAFISFSAFVAATATGATTTTVSSASANRHDLFVTMAVAVPATATATFFFRPAEIAPETDAIANIFTTVYEALELRIICLCDLNGAEACWVRHSVSTVYLLSHGIDHSTSHVLIAINKTVFGVNCDSDSNIRCARICLFSEGGHFQYFKCILIIILIIV